MSKIIFLRQHMENKMEYIMAQQTEMCHSCPVSECGVKLQQESILPVSIVIPAEAGIQYFQHFLITLFLDSHFRGNDIKRNFISLPQFLRLELCKKDIIGSAICIYQIPSSKVDGGTIKISCYIYITTTIY